MMGLSLPCTGLECWITVHLDHSLLIVLTLAAIMTITFPASIPGDMLLSLQTLVLERYVYSQKRCLKILDCFLGLLSDQSFDIGDVFGCQNGEHDGEERVHLTQDHKCNNFWVYSGGTWFQKGREEVYSQALRRCKNGDT